MGQLERTADELAAYEAFERYQAALEPEHRRMLAATLVRKAEALQSLARSEEAVAVYVDVAERFGQSDDPDVSAEVAAMLIGKGIVLNVLHRPLEAGAPIPSGNS